MKLPLFGVSGAGVTTLGEALSRLLDVPYLGSDAYYWEPSDPTFYQAPPGPGARCNPGARRSAGRRLGLGGSIGAWGQQ